MEKWKSGIEKWKNLFCSDFFYLNSKWCNEVNSVVKCEKMCCNGVQVNKQGVSFVSLKIGVPFKMNFDVMVI